MAAAHQTNDFIILGPAMASGSMVFAAIQALYFLPENFKLILTGSQHADQSFFSEVKSHVEHYEVAHRVHFYDIVRNTHAIILPNAGMSRNPNTVSGDSPEALASAILDIARAG